MRSARPDCPQCREELRPPYRSISPLIQRPGLHCSMLSDKSLPTRKRQPGERIHRQYKCRADSHGCEGISAVLCLAYVEAGVARLVSRRGNTFRSFQQLCQRIPRELMAVDNAILDGELVCVDAEGHEDFGNLLHR